MLTANVAVDLSGLSHEDLLRYAAKVDLENQLLRAQYDDVAAKLDWLRRQTFGPTSERTRRVPEQGQQALFGVPIELGPLSGAGTTTDETNDPTTDGDTTESSDEHAPAADQDRRGSPRRGHGRTRPAQELPAVEQVLTVPEVDRVQADGTPMAFLGYAVTELLDRVPAQTRRLIIKRERWGDPTTREPLIIAALPVRLVPKGKASDSFIQEAVVQKFFTGTPLHRQVMDINCQGAGVSRSFMSDMVKHAARLYAPVAEAILADVLTNRFVHADETPLPYQTGDGIKTGYLWAWLAGGQVAFHYGATRGAIQVQQVLEHVDDGEAHQGEAGVPTRPLIGFLITDGYAGYNHACRTDGAGLRRVYCWVHARRKFKPYQDDPNAAELVQRINDLFSIDRQARRDARARSLDPDQTVALIHQRRQELALPKLTALRERLGLMAQIYPDEGGIGAGISYLRERWDGFTVYTEHGFLPMDNNAAERALRRPVVGRKNYYFVGSEDAGDWAATHYSLMESCRMQDLDPRAYLAHITPRLLAANPTDPALLTPKAVRSVLKQQS